VTRFEGMVDKFTGDGIMALFGAPTALEDHARRACYAGLEMQRAVAAYAAELKEAEGIELALRVGINSGEVIVGDIATAERFTYTAIGHTVGLAQRMESLAQPHGRVERPMRHGQRRGDAGRRGRHRPWR
jgi:adenylate cyclase